jgi:hypothetical protein
VNENVDVVTRQLLTPVDVLNFPPDEILIRIGGRLIRARKNSFFNDAELTRRAEMGCVDRPDVSLLEPPYHTRLRAELGAVRFAELFKDAPEQPKKAKAEKAKPDTDAALGKALAALVTAFRQEGKPNEPGA